ncbi:hypothetical protein [Virgibacillus proomii]|uniref:hypothetical protein n=1 Tax=Virgibacillus proomii TaxID=84407 RepID=UPI001C10C95C|nr:hypothetical protein [Virgibacillus proomii]MBU5267324.1 hypothetical protein [Virgibacillus proomii]
MYHNFYYQNPYRTNQNPHHYSQHLKQNVLTNIEPIVQYGLKEAQYTSYSHALRESSAISYLMGAGYDPMIARQIVESWEVNETF